MGLLGPPAPARAPGAVFPLLAVSMSPVDSGWPAQDGARPEGLLGPCTGEGALLPYDPSSPASPQGLTGREGPPGSKGAPGERVSASNTGGGCSQPRGELGSGALQDRRIAGGHGVASAQPPIPHPPLDRVVLTFRLCWGG